MEKSQLIQVLRTFSRKELRELGKWVRSPAHNQREDVILMYDYLTEKDHYLVDEYLLKEDVFPYIYPNEDYDDARLRQTMHFFFKLIEDFLLYQEWSEDDAKIKLTLAKAYRKRKLTKAFLKNLRLAQRRLEEQPLRNEQFYQNNHSLQQEQYLFQSTQKRITEYNLQELSDSLDLTYLSEKLRQSVHMLTHQKVYKTNYNLGLIAPVLSYIEENNFLNIPAIGIYYYGLKTLTEAEDESNFFQLKKLIIENGALFPKDEMKDIYLMAINYGIGRMNAGMEQYYKEAFDLYKAGFESEVLIEKAGISRWTFLNVVSIGVKSEEYTWTEQFIENFQKYVDAEYRENIVCYALGLLHFNQKNYNKAMPLFLRVDYKDILLTLNTKALLLIMYYEQEEFDALESLIDSMQTYVRRKDVVGYHKQIYKNVIYLTKKLLRINPYNSKQKKQLKEEFETTTPLQKSHREWFLEKLDEMS